MAVLGQPLAHVVSGFTDAGVLDTHTTAWEVRDSSSVVVASGSGLNLNFTPTTPDTYTVWFTFTDDDGDSDSEMRTLDVSYANTQVGTCGDGTALVVGGLTVNDRIHVNPIGNDGSLQVQITNRTSDTLVYQQTFGPPSGGYSHIVIFGQGADEHIQLSGSIAIPACVFAGAGNDNVKGGSGADVLVGGEGDDLLISGSGRDLLIGGNGADRIIGNNDDDILVTGHVTAASHADLDTLLGNVQAAWTTADSYNTRKTNVSALLQYSGVGQNVFDDGATDTLTASAGQDLFFAQLAEITDKASNETLFAI